MGRSKNIGLLFLFITAGLYVQGQIRISGFVKDSIIGEVLIGAHVIEKDAGHATGTDNRGYFSMVVNTPVFLQASFVGYESKEIFLNSGSDSILVIALAPGTELEEVVIKASGNHSFNTVSINREQMLLTPSLGATPDILKTLQLQPGILSQNEGSSLLLVRGGNPGENLYLLDDVPLIYVNHLGGFMSVFNPDMINNITLYKGGFPARYGGKLSSVVDITQREGSSSGFKGSFGIGVTDASFTFEGPFRNKKITWIVTGRKTLTDLLLLTASKLAWGDYLLSYGFHDINSKFSWRPNEKNSVHLNIYQGDDYLNYWYNQKEEGYALKSRFTDIWGNLLAPVKWNHVLSPRLFVSNGLSYTRYRIKYLNTLLVSGESEIQNNKTQYLSSVQDILLHSGWKYRPLKSLSIEYGIQSAFLVHTPNQNFNSTPERIDALETSLYADNTLTLFNNSEIRIGARLTDYITDNLNRLCFEPRINMDFGLGKNQMVNLSYMRINQHSHLIFTSQTFLNNEIWVPADESIPSAQSDQFMAGWNISFDRNRYQASVEIYYKELRNLATYREGYTSLLGDGKWRTKIEIGGTGTAYGAEFLFKKNIGRLTGFLNYTYSKATRKYEGINEGQEYVFEYDRPHTGSVSLSYRINDKLTFSAVCVYQTGLPYTPAIGRQYTPDLKDMDGIYPYYYEALIYGNRNSERMRDYHRLDIALVYNKLTKRRKLHSTWTFSVYNVYNRQNPYYYYYNVTGTGEIYYPGPQYDYWKVKLYQVSFFPILPSVSYKVYFDSTSFQRIKPKTSFKQKINNWLYYEN